MNEESTPARLANLEARDIVLTKIRKVLTDEYLLCSGSLEDIYETVRRLAKACSMKPLLETTPEKTPITRPATAESFIKSANEKQIGGKHYKTTIEPWDFVLANNIGFLEGNAIKYIARHKQKNGIEDIDKAIHYLEKLKEHEASRSPHKENTIKDNHNGISSKS